MSTAATSTGPLDRPARGAWRPDPDTLAAIDRWLAYRRWQTRVPGVQAAIGLGGEELFSRAYGYADLQTRTPLRVDHLFRIASHSKTFTATVVLQLVEQGRLGLEDPVSAHVRELAEDSRFGPITVRELLEHTGGVLRDGLDADFWAASRPFPERAELLDLLRAGRRWEAGRQFGYSNLGFSVLGLVIESVTGLSYADATRTMITEPLELTDTTAEYVVDRADDYVTGYTALNTAVRRRAIPDVSTYAMAAATGFTSTAADLLVYFGAHRLGDDRLLPDRSKRRQQRRTNLIDPAKTDGDAYGLGLGCERVEDHVVVGHGGGFPGHITKTLLDPETGLVVSVLTNAIDGPASSLAAGVLRLLDRGQQAAADRTPVSAEARTRTGRYVSDWGVVDLAALGGSLFALSADAENPVDGLVELREETPDRWLISAGGGYGSVGEYVTFPDAVSARQGGLLLRRFDDLPERDDLFT